MQVKGTIMLYLGCVGTDTTCWWVGSPPPSLSPVHSPPGHLPSQPGPPRLAPNPPAWAPLEKKASPAGSSFYPGLPRLKVWLPGRGASTPRPGPERPPRPGPGGGPIPPTSGPQLGGSGSSGLGHEDLGPTPPCGNMRVPTGP